MGEVGASGTILLSGQLSEEEYNADLRGGKAVKVFDRMRRSDGQVKAVLQVCELPFHSATWTVQPASEDQADVDVAKFIERNLFDGMSITWDSFLHHILMMLPFGYSVFEKVYEIDKDGYIKWRKLAPRLQKTIWKWNLDVHGGLDGVEQLVFKQGTYKFIPIKADKLLVFTHEKEGSNFEGTSVLRSAYKHWYYKDHLYRIDGVASERHALGVPTFKHPPEISPEEKARLETMGEYLQAHEKMYIRLADSYDFDIKGLQGSIKDLMPSIEHHDRMIARSVLAQFLNLGTTGVGSFALARDQSSFFLMALKSLGKNICETINRYAIPQLVDFNFNVEAYPKLVVSGLETRNIDTYIKAIVDTTNAGALTIDKQVRDSLRGTLDLPPEPEQEEESEFEGSEEKPKFHRAKTFAEGFVAFEEIEKVLKKGEAEFITETKEVMDNQIANLADVTIKAIETKNLDKLDDIEVRYKTSMITKMTGVLSDMFKYGRLQVKKELSLQKNIELAELPVPIDPSELPIVKEFIKARAKASAGVMSNKLKQFVTFEALRQIKSGIVNKNYLQTGLTGLSDRELIASAGFSVGEAFNFGRSYEADKVKDDIDRVQYSALMDGGTCSECMPLDGKEWDYSDPQTAEYQAGNPKCLGGTRCRCVLVFISKAESPATVR